MKNFDNVETVDRQRHAGLRVRRDPQMLHTRELNLVSITLNEFGVCASNYPIVLIRNPDSGKFHPTAVLGFRPGENLYYGPESWESTYLPEALLRHPFIIGFDDRDEQSNKLTICLEKDSPLLNGEEGAELFTADGEDSEYLVSMKRLLSRIFDGERLTDGFMRKLEELDLIAPFDMILQPQGGEPRKLTGMYSIDEQKLKNLGKERIFELFESNYLQACDFMLGSLFQLHRMIKLRNRKNSQEQIVNYRIEPAGQSDTQEQREAPGQ